MLFSEHFGHKKVRDQIQVDSIDESLRVGLWNIVQVLILENFKFTGWGGYSGPAHLRKSENPEIYRLCRRLWQNYYKRPLDEIDYTWKSIREEIRRDFFSCQWYKIYDFLEFVYNNYDTYQFKQKFVNACNLLLEKELSAYRFVDGKIVQITDQTEIKEIQEALDKKSSPWEIHLHRALELLADRISPDYRNSIKESISAVESLVKLTLQSDSGTLGSLIKKLGDKIDLHSSLKSAFEKLYGYTSDEGGIRHALLEKENTDFNDAKFMLAVCSAFVNYVKGKINVNVQK